MKSIIFTVASTAISMVRGMKPKLLTKCGPVERHWTTSDTLYHSRQIQHQMLCNPALLVRLSLLFSRPRLLCSDLQHYVHSANKNLLINKLCPRKKKKRSGPYYHRVQSCYRGCLALFKYFMKSSTLSVHQMVPYNEMSTES